MTTEETPGALGSKDGLGAFFTRKMVKNATMTELAEARAKRGFCPKCQEQKLLYVNERAGMEFRQCHFCKAVVVLGA